MARAKEVRLNVDPAGHITVDPYYAIFRPNDRLVWKAPKGVAWTVGFQHSRTPVGRKVIQGVGAQMDGEHFVEKPGVFSYAVAVAGRGQNKLEGKRVILLEPSCPVIIIDNAQPQDPPIDQ